MSLAAALSLFVLNAVPPCRFPLLPPTTNTLTAFSLQGLLSVSSKSKKRPQTFSSSPSNRSFSRSEEKVTGYCLFPFLTNPTFKHLPHPLPFLLTNPNPTTVSLIGDPKILLAIDSRHQGYGDPTRSSVHHIILARASPLKRQQEDARTLSHQAPPFAGRPDRIDCQKRCLLTASSTTLASRLHHLQCLSQQDKDGAVVTTLSPQYGSTGVGGPSVKIIFDTNGGANWRKEVIHKKQQQS